MKKAIIVNVLAVLGVLLPFKVVAEPLSPRIIYANYGDIKVVRVSKTPFNGNGNTKELKLRAIRECNLRALDYPKDHRPNVGSHIVHSYIFRQSEERSPVYQGYAEVKLDTCPVVYRATLVYTCIGEWVLQPSGDNN